MNKLDLKEIAKIVSDRIVWESQNQIGWFICFYYNNTAYMLSDFFNYQKSAHRFMDQLRILSDDEFKKLVMRAIDEHRVYHEHQ